MIFSLLNLVVEKVALGRHKNRKKNSQSTGLPFVAISQLVAFEALEPRVLLHGGAIDGINDIDVIDGEVVIVETSNPAEPLPHEDNEAKQSEHLALLDLVKYEDVNRAAVKNGHWSNPTTWVGGLIPVAGSNVLIPHDIEVIYDLDSSVPVRTIRVDGELMFDHQKTTKLHVDTLVISPEGTLTIGTQDNPIASNVTATIVIVDNGEINTDLDPTLLSRGIISHGTVSIYGEAKSGFHSLIEAPRQGDTTLQLAGVEPTWRVGDHLVLTGTNPDNNEDEELELLDTTYDALRDVTILSVRPLQFDHVPPADDLSVYIANLTRNVVVTSENPEDIGRRGHVMLMHSSKIQIHHATFLELGRTDKKIPINDPVLNDHGHLIDGTGTNRRARYALHFHRTGIDPGGIASSVDGVVVNGSPGWGIVNHSSNVDVSDSVTFNVVGAGFVGETGNEIGSFQGNIAIRSEGSGEVPDKRQFFGLERVNDPTNPKNDDFGHSGHGFWLQGPGISVENNVAVGHRHAGFAFWSRGLIEFDLHTEEQLAKVSSSISVPSFDAHNVIGQPELTKGVDFVRSELVQLRSFKNNVSFASALGLDISRHMNNLSRKFQGLGWHSVVEDFTAWNIGTFTDKYNHTFNNRENEKGNNGVTIRYSRNIVFRNLRLIGQSDPMSVGVNRNHSATNISFENPLVQGFGVGIRLGQRGSQVVTGGVLNNDVNIEITSSNGNKTTLPLTVNIHGTQFSSITGTPSIDVDLKTESFKNVTAKKLFADTSIMLNSRQIYFDSQSADYILAPTLNDIASLRLNKFSIEKKELVGKTNQQLWEEFGLAVGGEITPNNVLTDARINGGLIEADDLDTSGGVLNKVNIDVNLKAELLKNMSSGKLFAGPSIMSNSRQMHFNSQSADYISAPTLNDIASLRLNNFSIEKKKLVGKTNQQLWEELGLAMDGAIAPDNFTGVSTEV